MNFALINRNGKYNLVALDPHKPIPLASTLSQGDVNPVEIDTIATPLSIKLCECEIDYVKDLYKDDTYYNRTEFTSVKKWLIDSLCDGGTTSADWHSTLTKTLDILNRAIPDKRLDITSFKLVPKGVNNA